MHSSAEFTSYLPSDDAAPSPHQGNAAVIEGPAKLSGCLSEQHKALSVRDDLGSIEGLESDTDFRAVVGGVATPRDLREGDGTRKARNEDRVEDLYRPYHRRRGEGQAPYGYPPGMTSYCLPAGPPWAPSAFCWPELVRPSERTSTEQRQLLLVGKKGPIRDPTPEARTG